MVQQIFVNLPVKDLAVSSEFFRSLGFAFNPQYSGETTTSVTLNDTITVMLLTHEFFGSFTPRLISDAARQTEVLICLRLDTRAEVDEMVRKAVDAGGSTIRDAQDHGFMYSHGFEDPDGHIWELFSST